jgi:hypothetical protein
MVTSAFESRHRAAGDVLKPETARCPRGEQDVDLDRQITPSILCRMASALGMGKAGAAAAEEVQLGLGWVLAVEPKARGALLQLRNPDGDPVNIEITITARGPVIRTVAAALELEATGEIAARCERFTVEAREQVEFRTKRLVQQASESFDVQARAVAIEATTGDMRLRANDDVQLLGEQILLNCERNVPLPSWLPASAPAEATLPREDAAGDLELLPDPVGVVRD